MKKNLASLAIVAIVTLTGLYIVNNPPESQTSFDTAPTQYIPTQDEETQQAFDVGLFLLLTN